MAEAAPPATGFAPFTSVDTHAPSPPVKDEVESPRISSTNALARYEYEAGRANAADGTKILMVEWEDDDSTRGVRGAWHISWDGSTRVLPANDNAPAHDVNRMYFLLPPGTGIPSSVTLTHKPSEEARTPVVWHTNPLPALFPPELGASARAAGKKGVLHTIWAKKRLQVLQREISAESRNNVEGVGLLMAVQEKEWIEGTFGVSAKPAGLNLSLGTGAGEQQLKSGLSAGPVSPRSPGGGRLMEKLAGLRLGTSEKELASGNSGGGGPQNNPLSPESSDVAISSFAVFKGANPASLAAKAPQRTMPSLNTQLQTSSPAHTQSQQLAPIRTAVQIPPPSLTAQQPTGFASLNALSGPTVQPPVFESRGPPPSQDDDDDVDDGLFALPISPRSPEVGKSPFSFAVGDTGVR